mgnify:CR=1 FL=1
MSQTGAVLGVLGLGLVMRLADMRPRPTTSRRSARMVSERGGVRRALRTGVLWGMGHTISILAAGIFVLGMRVAISERTSRFLEGGVALMIITPRRRRALAGASRPDGRSSPHPHARWAPAHPSPFSRSGGAPPTVRPGARGSGRDRSRCSSASCTAWPGPAALTLLVLTQTPSVILGLGYLGTFGIGSIGGMALMRHADQPAVQRDRRPAGAQPLHPHRRLRTRPRVRSLYAWSQLHPVAAARDDLKHSPFLSKRYPRSFARRERPKVAT